VAGRLAEPAGADYSSIVMLHAAATTTTTTRTGGPVVART
jgi:hypothetical protein